MDIDETLGFTVFFSLLALVIGACICVGIWSAHAQNQAAIRAGLQQCQTIGDRSYVWQKECAR